MPGFRRIFVVAIAIAAAGGLGAASAPPASAQLNTYTVTALAGVGGSVDQDESGVGNPAFQLGFSAIIEQEVSLGLRLGSIDYASGDRIGPLFDPGLRYLTASGEYTFSEDYYDSVVFIGIGLYDLEGRRAGRTESDTSIGGVLGVGGEFDMTRRLGFRVELSAHYLPGATAEFFILGLGGLAFNF